MRWGRIEADDHAIAAIAELRADAALREAAAVDRGERTGSLAGVPITIKEAIRVAGMRSCSSTPIACFADLALEHRRASAAASHAGG